MDLEVLESEFLSELRQDVLVLGSRIIAFINYYGLRLPIET